MKLSVVLPVYNGAATLRDAIESVCLQNFDGYELIVIDDCSTDESPQILQEFEHHEFIIFHRNKTNLGLFASLNHGISLASGSVIKLWAQDDIMMPNCLEQFSRAAKSNPKASFIWCWPEHITETGKLSTLELPEETSHRDGEVRSIKQCLKVFFFCGSLHGNISLLGFSKDTFTTVGPFQNFIYSGDIDFTERALAINNPVCIPQKLVWLRDHAKQLSRSTNHLHHESRETFKVLKTLSQRHASIIDSDVELKAFVQRCIHERVAMYHLANAKLLVTTGKTHFAFLVFMDVIRGTHFRKLLWALFTRWLKPQGGVIFDDYSPKPQT